MTIRFSGGACDPICDFCTHYAFNANDEGAYTGNGRCEHPEHPQPMEPWMDCGDFACGVCPTHNQMETDS